jgi:hypothetical protein
MRVTKVWTRWGPLLMGACLTLSGCGDDDGAGEAEDAAVDTATPPDATAVQCTPPEPVTPADCDDNAEGETRLYLIHMLDIARRELGSDVVPGFNVDGCVTEPGGPTGCGQKDWEFDVNHDGTLEQGIDNQLATIAGVLEAYVDVQTEVDEGNTLLLVEVSGLNDPTDDTCVDVAILSGSLPPEAELQHDEDGRLSADQAFELDTAAPILTAQGVLSGGRLLLGPTDVIVTMTLADAQVDFPIDPAWITFTMTETSLDVGLIGGGSELNDLIDAVVAVLPDDVEPEVAHSFLAPLTDLNPDEDNENCTAISLAMEFEAVTAERAE